MRWHLRSACVDDWPAIEATHRAAIATAAANGLSPREQAAWLAMPLADLRAGLEASEGACVVGEAAQPGSGVAGYAWASVGVRPHLRGLYVDPRARRQGLGVLLTRAIEQSLRAQGVDMLFVAAARDAVDFYLGCEYVGGREFVLHLNDGAGPVPLLLRKMWKRLD